MEFHPDSTSAHGIDVDRIDETWAAATTLDTPLLEGRLSKTQLAQLENSALSFSTQADLDGDRAPELFSVGVFETNAGTTGRFVAVTESGRVVQVFQQSGTPGFSALFNDSDQIRWYKCMECGEFETIRWTGSSYILE